MKVEARSLEWFSRSRENWSDLLQESLADPLFMSWDWQMMHWKHYSSLRGSELTLLTVSTTDGELVGIAPFCICQLRIGKVYRVRSIQFLAAPWQRENGAVSEHQDVIAKTGMEQVVAEKLIEFLLEQEAWDDFSLAYIPSDSVFLKVLTRVAGERKWYARVDARFEYYSANTSGSFEAYVRSLSHSARRKTINKRALLAKLGEVEIRLTSSESVGRNIRELRRLHSLRWIGFDNTIDWEFVQKLAERFVSIGLLRLTVLTVDSRAVSANMNIRVDDIEYNLVSAIDDAFAAQISPGFLHHGYCLEQAFSTCVKRYDLLAGPGKNDQYKSLIAKRKGEFFRVQFIRNRRLQRVFRTKDWSYRQAKR